MNIVLKKVTCLILATILVVSPMVEFKRVEAQVAGGAIAATILQCSGIISKITDAIGSVLKSAGINVPVDDTENNAKENCLDGIAYALAKTLLAQMTDSTINWINNGFEGKPSYIGDFKSFFGNEIKNELQLGLEELKRTGTIYFDIIRQESILRIRQGLRESNLIYTLDADIVKAICTYDNPETETFCSQQLTPESRSELVESYLNGQIAGREVPWDWNVWLSMTQNCGNNPFCALTTAQNDLNARAQERITELNTELNRSGGFLGQKECKDRSYNRRLQDWTDDLASYSSTGNISDIEEGTSLPDRPQCDNWGVTTPGSVVADKIKLSLGTSERQLEMADELNESIAAIFDALLNKLIEDGLASFNEQSRADGNDSYYSIRLDDAGFGSESTVGTIVGTEGGCTAVGGVYDPDLEICDFQEGNSVPAFPWTMENGSILENDADVNRYVTENIGMCVEINRIRIIQGAEPCLTGTSVGGNSGGGNVGAGPVNGTATLNPSNARANTQAQIVIVGGPANIDFEIIVDGDFISASVSSGTGGATESIRLPANYIEDSEILVAFGDGTELVVSKN